MFGRKYVFETKTTRLRRLFLSGALFTLIALTFVFTFIIYIPIYAKMQKGRADGAFYQKSPDAIAVFTGDKGRISYALEHLKKNPTSKLFISGVYATNSFETLLKKQSDPTTNADLSITDMQVDLDYKSTNTFENVRETVKFLNANPQLNKVLIISSDYHILRINFIFSHYIKSSKPEFFYDSIPYRYNSWKENKKLLMEALKIFRTFFLLKILREDDVLDD